MAEFVPVRPGSSRTNPHTGSSLVPLLTGTNPWDERGRLFWLASGTNCGTNTTRGFTESLANRIQSDKSVRPPPWVAASQPGQEMP